MAGKKWYDKEWHEFVDLKPTHHKVIAALIGLFVLILVIGASNEVVDWDWVFNGSPEVHEVETYTLTDNPFTDLVDAVVEEPTPTPEPEDKSWTESTGEFIGSKVTEFGKGVWNGFWNKDEE